MDRRYLPSNQCARMQGAASSMTYAQGTPPVCDKMVDPRKRRPKLSLPAQHESSCSQRRQDLCPALAEPARPGVVQASRRSQRRICVTFTLSKPPGVASLMKAEDLHVCVRGTLSMNDLEMRGRLPAKRSLRQRSRGTPSLAALTNIGLHCSLTNGRLDW